MEGNQDLTEKGIIPSSFEQIFTHIFSQSPQKLKQYLVKASYLEIYNEQLRDLLLSESGNELILKHKKKLEIREKMNECGIYIKGLTSIITKNIEEIQNLMNIGKRNRMIGSTNMNEFSSRSHTIFIIIIECSEFGVDGKNHIKVGQLNLVDLAGSERQNKTGAIGERFKESTKINLSLCALGNVISAIADGKNAHIPYRDSKLTRILQNSLGGNAKTIMIANIGPADYNYEETVMTLRGATYEPKDVGLEALGRVYYLPDAYANRAKNIKNKPIINEDPKDASLRGYQLEIERLKKILSDKQQLMVITSIEKGETNSLGGSINIKSDKIDDLEAERSTIVNDHKLIKKEKAKLLAQLEEREKMLCEEALAQSKLLQRIKDIESKLLSGNLEILQTYQTKQEIELFQKRKQIAEERRKELEIIQQLEVAEENTLECKESFNSIQQEIDIKTKKIKRIYLKYRSLKNEIDEVKDINAKELQELYETQRELIKNSKLKLMVIEQFVPLEIKMRYLKFSYYDQAKEEWKLYFSKFKNTNSFTPPFLSSNSTNHEIVNEKSVSTVQYIQNLFTSGQFTHMPNKNLLEFDERTGLIKRPKCSSIQGYNNVGYPFTIFKKIYQNSMTFNRYLSMNIEMNNVIFAKKLKQNFENRIRLLPINIIVIPSHFINCARPNSNRMKVIDGKNTERPENVHIVDCVTLLKKRNQEINDNNLPYNIVQDTVTSRKICLVKHSKNDLQLKDTGKIKF